MGSFLGHIVPGTFFFAFAFWWLYSIFYRYFYAKRFRPLGYRNQSSFPSINNFPGESIFKLVAVLIGMLGEFFTAFDHGHFTHLGNAQHMTMFFFFGFNAIVDLCIWKKWTLPPKLDYITAALAFSIEGFLFFNHLHGRPHMDIQVHMFLFYVIVLCVISTLLEMYFPSNVVPALCRTLFTLLQGTWFYQIGFILYPPIGQKWDTDDHEQMMVVTLIFTWHVAILVASMFILGTLIYLRVQNLKGPGHMYQMISRDDVNDNDVESNNDKNKINSPISNGHANKSNKKSTIHQIIDSESEEI